MIISNLTSLGLGFLFLNVRVFYVFLIFSYSSSSLLFSFLPSSEGCFLVHLLPASALLVGVISTPRVSCPPPGQ